MALMDLCAAKGDNKVDMDNLPELQGISLLTTSTYTYESLSETAKFLLDRTSIRPAIGLICGTGLNHLADLLKDSVKFPYEDIPNFPVSTVEGHIGQLVFGYLENIPVVCMQGRIHYYEGYPLWKCCMPIRVMKLLGVSHLIATNAAGGVNSDYVIGDIMLIKDHINIMGFAGNSPLLGPNDERFGPRFHPMNNAYNKEIISIAKEVSKSLDMEDLMREGVYSCVGGPNFETVAEVKILQLLGVDAIGMSTVHEIITARHCDLTVFAFSLITNIGVADYDSTDEPNHGEIQDVGKLRQEILAKFVSKLVERINEIIKGDKK